jgi:hypothetical protein
MLTPITVVLAGVVLSGISALSAIVFGLGLRGEDKKIIWWGTRITVLALVLLLLTILSQ